MQLARGKYLVRVSGVYTNSLGQMGNSDKITFLFTVPGKQDKLKKTVTMYSISGYSYPFFLSEILDCSEGEAVLEVEGAAANWNLTNTHIITCPIADLKWLREWLSYVKLNITSINYNFYFITTHKICTPMQFLGDEKSI